LEIKVKYHLDELERIKKIRVGDWIDLRSAEKVIMPPGSYRLISLGISVELPCGYEAHIAPRSSTFINFGIIMVNSPGIIDETYCGNNDIWYFSAYALNTCNIKVNDRICQFRIVEKQQLAYITEVDFLENDDRGGFGSTGIK